MSAKSSSFLPQVDSGIALRKIRVLLLEDSESDAVIVVHELRQAGFLPDWQRVDTEAAYMAALETSPDIILADYSLPKYDGMRALELLRERGLDIPFILISGAVGEDNAVGAMRRGAADYLLKDRLARLGSAVSHALENKRLREKRKAAEDKVDKAAAMQSAILNALPAHIALLDSQGIIVAVNESWRRFATTNALQSQDFCLGSSYIKVCEETAGEGWEEAREVAKGLRRMLDGELPEIVVEYPCHSPNEKRWFRLVATVVRQGRKDGVVVMHANISEHKLAEEALRSNKLQQRLLAERLVLAQAVGNVGSWETNLATMEVHWTEQTHRIFETDPDTFKPTHAAFLKFVHPEDRDAVDTAFQESLGKEGLFSIEHRILLSEGRSKTVEERWRTFIGQDKQPNRAIGTCQDITARKQLEDQLRQTDKMNAIGQLAGGVAHDFNNQLNVIMGYAVLIKDNLTDEKLKRFASSIITSVQRSADLTKNLLAFSRKGQLQTTPLSIHQILVETRAMLEHSIDKRIGIKSALNADVDVVLGDPSQIQNALLNLAVNARDAMPNGGIIAFETKTMFIDPTAISRHADDAIAGEYIKISVTDSGSGMSDEVQQHLFEPFFTTKPVGKGTGMGLASVFGTVKIHKGLIDVNSELGRGTTFTIYLPLERSKEASRSNTMTAVKVEGKLRILLAEDEEILRNMYSEMLHSSGHEIIEAENGRDAVNTYRKDWKHIDLVILDMVMPELSGPDAFCEMKKINPQIKAFLATGYSLNNEVQAALDSGVLDFIQKPFTPTALLSAIAKVMNEWKKN